MTRVSVIETRTTGEEFSPIEAYMTKKEAHKRLHQIKLDAGPFDHYRLRVYIPRKRRKK